MRFKNIDGGSVSSLAYPVQGHLDPKIHMAGEVAGV
jgi:hypothetical protein